MKQCFCKVVIGLLIMMTFTGLLAGCGGRDNAAFTAVDQLNDSKYTIGVMQGASGQNEVPKALPNAKMEYYTKVVDAYLAVQQGKLDALVFASAIMESAIARGLTGVKLLPENIGPPTNVAIGISRKSSIQNLQEKLNEFIAELKSDGTLDDMYQRWISKASEIMPDIPKPENPTLTIKAGTTGLVQPFSYYKGDQLYGYDIELIYRFASWMNAKVEISTYDYNGIISAAESGKIDCIIANLNVTEERKKSILFSDTIYETNNVMMVKDWDSNRVPVETARIGVMDGSTNEIYAEEHYPNADRQNFKNYVDSSTALSSGKLDYAIMDYTNALRFTRSNTDLEIASEPLTDEKLCIGVRKEQSDLYTKVNEVMNRFLADGTVDAAIDRWIKKDGSDYDVVETPKLSDAPKIKVGIVSSREPTTFMMNGKFVGLDIEIIDRILYELGYQAEYMDMEWSAVIAAIESGKIDITLGMYNTPERAEKILFTEPYFTNPLFLVARKSTQAQVDQADDGYTSLSQFEGKKIGIVTGSIFDEVIAPIIRNCSYSYYQSASDCVTALKNGKIDGFPVDKPMALMYAANNPDLDIIPDAIVESGIGMAFKKNSPLTAEFNREIARLKQEGILDELSNKWSGADESVKTLPEFELSGENGVLRVACAPVNEPMCYIGKDGTPIGYEVELLMHIAQALGKRLEFTSVDFSGLTPMIESGKSDVAISCMTISEERKRLVDMTDSHHSGDLMMLVRKYGNTDVGEYTSLSQLSGKTLSSVTGFITDQFVIKTIPDVKISYFNNTSDELAALKNKKVEGMIIDEPIAELIMAQNDDLITVPELVAEDSYGMALPKDSPMTAVFNSEIDKLKKDGTIDAIFNKWSGEDESVKTLPNLDYPAPNGIMRIASSAAMEPMSYIGSDGVPKGFEVELAMRIAQSLGKKVELISVEFAGLMPMLQSGKADVILGCLSITDERKQTVDMTNSYYNGGITILVRKAQENMAVDSGFLYELKQSFIRTFVTENRWKLVLSGLMVTVVLSVCSGILGSAFGFGICMLRRSKRRLVSAPTAIFIRIIQGTPIVVLLMILYYVIFGQLNISAIVVAIFGFAVNFGVYVSEMLRTGIDAVDKGQIEAAHALGFTKMRTFWRITFPQAARHFLPVFKGEFISMVKMTSVVGYIAIQDITKVSDIIRSRTLEAFFPLIVTAILYFIVANLLTMLLSRIEVRLDTKRGKHKIKGVIIK